MALLTQSEYARHRKECALEGGTHTAIQRALESGRISYASDKLIDPEQADKDWLQNTEPRPSTASKPPVKKSKSVQVEPVDADYNVSRAKREFYDSELARLKVEEKRGSLVPASVVRTVLYEAGRIIRAGHEDIVSQLAPDLASETVINVVERILKERLNRLDNDLADRVANLGTTLLDAEKSSEAE